MKNNRLILWLVIGLTIMTLTQNLGGNESTDLATNDLGIATAKTEYGLGKEILLSLQNNTEEDIELSYECNEEPFDVQYYENGEWINVGIKEDIECEPFTIVLAPEESTSISYKNWAYRVFGELGRYQIEIEANIRGETKAFSSNEFTIEPRGIIGRTWLNIVYQPILNGLVFLIEKVPGNNLGLAIIILTLFIRTLLLIPSQRAMRSQRKMQEVQPKLDEIRKKYKDNQEKIAMETMKIWQTHKVNPFGSCMLMFIQFPILIALYYVVREGLHEDKMELLYGFISESFSFDLMQTNFLGILELTEMNFFVLPLIVGGLQFVQMNLALSRAKKKKEAKKDSKGGKEKDIKK
ncbi:MAG: YidC/Oxa1 family membrane protein insertase, partial [Candidatus Peregrinibacteria bacterium]|nr:YidC/Oxa1 family membrane protein insertase [Candidatus Peregrinibacteria bacterium]